MNRPEPCPAISSCIPARICLLAALLAFAGGAGACSRAKPRQPREIESARAASAAMPPAKIVLDYRYGWYHKATGYETIGSIAREYDRDAQLVAGLNQTQLEARPYAGKMIYIPPNNDREYVRQALVKINADPSVVPRTPWKPEKAGGPAESLSTLAFKQNETGLKTKVAASLKEAPVSVSRRGDSRPLVSSRRPAKTEEEKPAAAKSTSGGAPVRVASSGIAGIVPLAASPSGVKLKPSPSGFAWPLEGKVITAFSEGWSKACHGIEIAAAEGTTVRASRGGKVLLAQEFPGYGQLILIDHGDGLASVYAYLQSIKVREGSRAEQGDVIATSGQKYSSPLLFFQIRKRGVKVDPMEYLP